MISSHIAERTVEQVLVEQLTMSEKLKIKKKVVPSRFRTITVKLLMLQTTFYSLLEIERNWQDLT